jgi:hypothetical protein
MTEPRDPQTPAEWQEAVDLATFYLALDSARKYGFVTGGPEVNVERTELVLNRGRELGFVPSSDAIERCLNAFIG